MQARQCHLHVAQHRAHITGAVGAARIGGGWLVDHFAAARVGVGAHACSLAGALSDRTGSYASTVWVAAGINVLGMLVAGRLPAR